MNKEIVREVVKRMVTEISESFGTCEQWNDLQLFKSDYELSLDRPNWKRGIRVEYGEGRFFTLSHKRHTLYHHQEFWHAVLSVLDKHEFAEWLKEEIRYDQDFYDADRKHYEANKVVDVVYDIVKNSIESVYGIPFAPDYGTLYDFINAEDTNDFVGLYAVGKCEEVGIDKESAEEMYNEGEVDKIISLLKEKYQTKTFNEWVEISKANVGEVYVLKSTYLGESYTIGLLSLYFGKECITLVKEDDELTMPTELVGKVGAYTLVNKYTNTFV